MGNYEQNIQLLKVRYPKIHQRLAKRGSPRFTLEMKAGSEVPLITAKDERGRFYLHSPYNPVEEAKRLVEGIPLERLSSLWVMGVGIGYHVGEILSRKQLSYVTIIIESDINLFDVFLRTNIATHALMWQNFLFITGSREEIDADIRDLLGSQVNFKMGRSHFLMPQGFERYDGEAYREFSKTVIDYTKYRYANLGNSIEDTLDGLKNTFDSVEVLCGSPGICDLKDKYRGLPAIIVSAGPSLDKNVDLLHEVKGKALIISSDTTFPILVKKGIEPNLVATVERVPEVYRRYYEKTEIPRDTWLAALNVADPRIFEQFPSRHLMCVRTTEPLSDWIDEFTDHKGGVSTGLSTSHLAFSCAAIMGCEPIILIGQDLALGENDRYYAKGGSTEDCKEDTSAILTVKDWNGNDIRTTQWLKIFKEWFEMTIPKLGVHCINATEGGALIEGTEMMTLREAIDRYCFDTPPIPKIESMIGKPRLVSIDRVQDELLGMARELEEIIDFLETQQDLLAKQQERLEEEHLAVAHAVQEIVSRVILTVYSRRRTAFFLQAVSVASMTRINNFGLVKEKSEVNDFYSYIERVLREMSQVCEVCLYETRKYTETVKRRRKLCAS